MAERDFDAIVVGAGFSGLYMLHKLHQLGLSSRLLEAGPAVGGTWYWNRYPGLRCDVASMTYSYSFSDEIQQEWTWSERYAPQAEILRYINHVADHLDLRRDIQLNTRVMSAAFDEKRNRWTVRTAAGETFSAKFTIMATGCLSVPNTPDFEGLGGFAGDRYHTANWPHDGVDFTGKRVGLIGTGSSGVQAIPIIAKQAKHLTVFQRAANFSIPARNAPLTPEAIQKWKSDYPRLRQIARASRIGDIFAPPTKSALEVSAEEREAAYEQRWREGSFSFLSTFNDILVNGEASQTAADFVNAKIRTVVKDPDVADLLIPKGVPFGTKRLCFDTGYYESFNRENVTLVDVKADPIVRVTRTGLKTRSRDFKFDSLVLATGFDAMTGALFAVDIRGRGGQALRDKWRDGPKTYLGLAVAGFPNFFTITGPGSPSVVTYMMVSIEQHVEWIADCLKYLTEKEIDLIEATPASEETWTRHVNEVADNTLFPRADSWYVGANIPGKPRVIFPYLGGLGAYAKICDDVAAKSYRGFALTKLDDAGKAERRRAS
jgi:cyclohexanone monooxygenase